MFKIFIQDGQQKQGIFNVLKIQKQVAFVLKRDIF